MVKVGRSGWSVQRAGRNRACIAAIVDRTGHNNTRQIDMMKGWGVFIMRESAVRAEVAESGTEQMGMERTLQTSTGYTSPS